jgi:site-specific DNA recombinase
MIAAIYARKSTDQNVSDEEKSVTRQIERARAYAERKSWIVADEHVYADDGISGAEFVKRPGFLRLMNALHPRAPFQVLIMSEESRLGREQIATAVALKQITDAGVRLFFYLEDRERTLNTATEKFMLSVANFAAEMEREKARQRTRDAMQRKASRGHVAGGKVYGYRNVRVADHVERVIVPDEAAILRRIFEEVAQGRGYARIAKSLNADAIPGPAFPRRRLWAMTGVRDMLFRELYRGRIVWGRRRNGVQPGRHHATPPGEWLTLDAPALRIIPEELWRAAHARIARTRAIYLRQNGGTLNGRPGAGHDSHNLLGGFLTCGECGGSMHAIKRPSRRGRPRVCYMCNNWRVNSPRQIRNPERPRGQGCGNSWSVPLGDLDVAVLGMLRNDVLTPDIIEAVVERAAALYAADPDAYAARRQACASEAEGLAGEIVRLTEAIASGGELSSLVAALKDRERRRADLLAQVEHLDGLAKAPTWADDVRAEIRRRLADWRGLLGREPEIARQILRKLLDGRLTLTPKVTSAGQCYELTGRATYGRLFEGVVATGVTAPAGYRTMRRCDSAWPCPPRRRTGVPSPAPRSSPARAPSSARASTASGASTRSAAAS